MFYKINQEVRAVAVDSVNDDMTVAGYVTSKDLMSLYPVFGFSKRDAEACLSGNLNFRSAVSVYEKYTFTELRLINSDDADSVQQDCIAMFVTPNMLLLVDVEDEDDSTRKKFEAAIERIPAAGTTLERAICSFLDSLISNDITVLENTGRNISALEEDVFHDRAGKDFNLNLLVLKKDLLSMHSYYEQLLDITETLEENSNDLFPAANLLYISNLTKKVRRLKEDVDSLRNSVDHLQDAYSSFIDTKMNNSMKFFTVLTSIFFPLTIIVGWYGMNFRNMPELYWKYGYLYVICLSVAVIAFLVLWGRHKKWF